MDDQFRGRGRTPDRKFRRARPPARPGRSPISTPKPGKPKDEYLIDLYDDVKKPAPGEPDPELEELKKLAQSDALKAYVWLRYRTSALGAKLKHYRSQVTPKHLKLAKIGAACLIVGILAINILPGIISRFTGDSDILGTQDTADFATLEPGNTEPTDRAFDEEVGVSIYKDNISNVAVTVSQQVLPENLKNNPAELQKLAISLDSKTSINRHETQKGLIYIAETEEETNIVIFNHNNLLVFIRSAAIIDDQAWIDYVNQLQ